jgi:dipeptidase D
VALAPKLGVECFTTAIGNVVMRKKATEGSAKRKKIVLQAHMDMVPSKTKESQHDFLHDPIDAYIDGEWVTANQTTLGADNGMGVAMALAVLESHDIKHNDIEVLITTDEEAGMSGAFGLVGNEISGNVLINLDSEEDDVVCIGCAGGINTNVTYPISMVNTRLDGVSFKIELKDLFSGHSGVDIPLGRANAIKEMANILVALNNQFGYELAAINGGKLRNVIPSYCEAVINVESKDSVAVKEFISAFQADLQQEFAATDPELKLSCTEISSPIKVIESRQALAFVLALASAFNGVWRMNNELGIAETSSNIGVIVTNETSIQVTTLQRSAMHAPKMKVATAVAAAFKQIGASVEHSDSYPGWQPNITSPALAKVKEVYQTLFGEAILVGATHGGLECGLIMDKFAGLDAISIGATIRFPHSPNEKINIQSVAKSWRLLTELIEAI